MVARALKEKGNHRVVKSPTGSKELLSLPYNSRVHSCGVGGLQELAVDKKRAVLFLRSLDGKLKRDEYRTMPRSTTCRCIKFSFSIYLHRVEDPIWTIQNVSVIVGTFLVGYVLDTSCM